MRTKLLSLLAAVGLVVGLAQPVNASVVMTLTDEFSGADEPVGEPVATFVTTNTNEVTLTMDASSLPSVEFISQWYFNLDPALTLSGLTATIDAGDTSFTTFVDPTPAGTVDDSSSCILLAVFGQIRSFELDSTLVHRYSGEER